MSKFEKKYEWVGDVESYKEPKENENSIILYTIVDSNLAKFLVWICL